MENDKEVAEQIEAMRIVAEIMRNLTPFSREQLSIYIRNLTGWMNEKPEAKVHRIDREIKEIEERRIALEMEREQLTLPKANS